jgi:hypothetical protein
VRRSSVAQPDRESPATACQPTPRTSPVCTLGGDHLRRMSVTLLAAEKCGQELADACASGERVSSLVVVVIAVVGRQTAHLCAVASACHGSHVTPGVRGFVQSACSRRTRTGRTRANRAVPAVMTGPSTRRRSRPRLDRRTRSCRSGWLTSYHWAGSRSNASATGNGICRSTRLRLKPKP